jgi:hypothetical protein
VAPSYFPQVPRVGFNWAVSDTVTIKGDAYFALTSSCIMAGGGLEILFQDGDLQAWFTAHADVLVSWHPFFFQAEISISIGVSYRLNLLFCHKTITVSIGADLSLWGPPTGGIVRIDLVVVSFSVRFGSDSAATATDPLQWDQFKALLPAVETICRIAITDGLYKTQDAPVASTAGGATWVVRAKRVHFQTRSAIPASDLNYDGSTLHTSTSTPTGIAIKAMDLSGVTSTHTLKIFEEPATTPIDAVAAGWTLEQLTQSVPASLWGEPPQPFSQVPAQPSADVIDGALCGFSVTAPAPQPGDSRGPVELETLMEEYLTPPGQAPLSAAATRSADYVGVADEQTVGLIGQTMGTTAKQGRDGLFAALTGSSAFAGANGDLTRLAQQAQHLYSDSPLRQS